MKVSAIAINTFREAVRNKILYSVILFAILVVGGATVFGRVTIGDTTKVIKDFGLFSLSFFGAVITIVSGVTLLAKEMKQKTVYNIVSKPLARWQFILGKYLGLVMTVSTIVLTMGLGLWLYIGLYQGELDSLILIGTFFVLLEVAILAAIAIFFSTVAVEIPLTGIFTLGAWIAGRSISYVKVFVSNEGTESGPLVWLTRALDLILPDFELLNFADDLVHGVSPGLSQMGYSLGYAILYCSAVILIASAIFSKRELV